MKRVVTTVLFVLTLGLLSVCCNADSVLVHNISFAFTEPVIDAEVVPDSVYGDTVVMYVKNSFPDDSSNEDLSDFSGSFYTVWRDGKLFFHFLFRGFSDNDEFSLYFDLDNVSETYGNGRTAKIDFIAENGDVRVRDVSLVKKGVDSENFKNSIICKSQKNSDVTCIEFSIDFSLLYSGFSFNVGDKIGFDMVVFDFVDGGVVRFAWNDDTGKMMSFPNCLGTFQLERSVETSDILFGVDKGVSTYSNPGTSDGSYIEYLILFCFGLALSVKTFRKI